MTGTHILLLTTIVPCLGMYNPTSGRPTAESTPVTAVSPERRPDPNQRNREAWAHYLTNPLSGKASVPMKKIEKFGYGMDEWRKYRPTVYDQEFPIPAEPNTSSQQYKILVERQQRKREAVRMLDRIKVAAQVVEEKYATDYNALVSDTKSLLRKSGLKAIHLKTGRIDEVLYEAYKYHVIKHQDFNKYEDVFSKVKGVLLLIEPSLTNYLKPPVADTPMKPAAPNAAAGKSRSTSYSSKSSYWSTENSGTSRSEHA